MGLLSRLLGSDDERAPSRRFVPRPEARSPVGATDARAIERYRYMIKTAPPETIQQAHAEAFERLTPEQRRQLLHVLARVSPASESRLLDATSSQDTEALARAATRVEIRQPGVIERTLSQPGMGFGGGLLASFAAGFAGSLVAQSFLSARADTGGDAVPADDDWSADTQELDPPADDASPYDLVDDDGNFDLSSFEI
jgi:hypothetical protein